MITGAPPCRKYRTLLQNIVKLLFGLILSDSGFEDFLDERFGQGGYRAVLLRMGTTFQRK